MSKYIVIGLESTATRLVSRLIAINLGIIADENDWDGIGNISDENNSVTHSSMPYGQGSLRHIPDKKYIKSFDFVIITTRDINCVISSKLNIHDKNIDSILTDNKKSLNILSSIIKDKSQCYIFSYESAVMLQESYTRFFLKQLNIDMIKHILFVDKNKKYFYEETT